MLTPSRRALSTLLALLLTACSTTPRLAPESESQFPTKDTSPMDPIIHAPDFPADFAWLNTDQPLSFKGNLKGQIVVMDFWCYCCINCMHILPDLAYLEEKYQNDPVVILGIHSNKYDNESDPANIRAAIQRYNIHHPVLVDQGHKVWDAYDVNSWPTLVVVGPDARIVGGISGEGHRDLLDKVIAQALAQGRAKGTLAAAPLKLAHEGQVLAATGLSFPGKVIPDAAGNRLFIIDSNHNRIVITSYPDAMGHAPVQTIIGSGDTGAADGTFAQASFNRPQGAALSPGAGNTLYIADTENHLVRRVDLDKKTVSTILGTGKQVFDPEAGKSGRQQGLNSPWDVAIGGNRLYIAQAGQHQIFAMNLMTGMTEVAAGTARENIRDGAAREAFLAQPSGLALDAKNQVLYFADSEVSAIRALDLKTNQVSTLVGRGLFTFGDADGDANSALLQHALGVALLPDSTLLVADTYNHKIKSLNPATRTLKTLLGTGKPGTGAGPGAALQLFEPASHAAATPTQAFIADTNNHRIVQWNPQSGQWKELVIDGLNAATNAEPLIAQNAQDIGIKTLNSNQPVNLELRLALPPGNHLTAGAPISVQITDGTRKLHTATLSPETELGRTSSVSLTLPPEALAEKPRTLYITIYYTHCSQGLSAVCTPAQSAWKVSPTFEPTGPTTLKLDP